MKTFAVQLTPEARAKLEDQAQELGFQTGNQWASLILTTFAQVPQAGKAFLLLGKVKTLPKSNNPRFSDL